MSEFKPADPDFEARCRASFGRQLYMAHLGARLEAVRPGYAEIHLPFRSEVRQQDGYVHGGAIASILDSVAGYAAFSLVPADINILTVE